MFNVPALYMAPPFVVALLPVKVVWFPSVAAILVVPPAALYTAPPYAVALLEVNVESVTVTVPLPV